MMKPAPSPEYDVAARAQAIAANPNHPAWVSANAGSGKTKVLIDRVARLLLKGAKPDSILCVTYTKAAANEMLQRLFDRLGRWSVMAEDALREELTELENRKANPYTEDEIRAARALFARALETPGGLRIETIHAFCARILRRFPLEARTAPGFTEIDDVEKARLWDEALEAGLTTVNAQMPDILDIVSLAGGGLGAIAGLEAARAHADMVLGFSDKAGSTPDAIDAALRKALTPPAKAEDELLASAMEDELPTRALGAAAHILEADGKAGSLKAANLLHALFKAETAAEKWSLYGQLFFTQKGDMRKTVVSKPVLKNADMAALFQTSEVPEGSEILRIKQLDADLKSARLFARTRALLLVAVPVLEQYRALKRARAVIDFDDLITLTHTLLTARNAASWVLYKLDGGLTHVLLDEAQDTSPEQWGLLNALTAEFFAGKGIEKAADPRTLFVVGDEKQSIYSFQGADPQHFLAERQGFEARARASFGKAELPEMAMSFRSSPEILEFVDKISECGSVDGHPYIAGPVAEANLSRHTARRANQPGCVELWPVEVPAPQDEAIAWHAPRDTQSASSPKNKLAQDVANNIDRLLKAGETIWAENADRTWSLRPATPGDVLILVDTRTGGLFDALIDALKTRSVPVAGADRLILADHIGVQDCLNLIRFALLPTDDLNLAEILRGPFAGLVDDDEHLFALAHDRPASLWDALQRSADPRHAPICAFLSELLTRAHLPTYEFLTHILEQENALGETGWGQLAARLGPPMRDPVQALLFRAMAHDAKGAASLQSFVAQMDLDRTQIKRDLAAPDGSVRVMTVHGAKGLQAPIVILPDTTKPTKPARPSLAAINGAPAWLAAASEDTPDTALAREDMKTRAERERRRLLYVALTRAQDRLILCGAWSGQRPKPDTDKAPGPGYTESSWYALCAEAMAGLLGELPAGPDERPVFCRYGPQPQTAEKTRTATETPPPPPRWLHEPAPAETSQVRITAPSALVPGQTPVLPPMGATRARRLKRGRLIHALLERLPALPAAIRADAGARFLARDGALTDAEREEMLAAAMNTLTDPAFAEVFAEGGRAEAPVIGTAPGLPEGVLINGRVDRLVVSEQSILIIDFKTDRPPPDRATDVSPSYLGQMGAYRAVLERAYPGRTIRAALVWTDGPQLMELPADLLEEALSQASLAV